MSWRRTITPRWRGDRGFALPATVWLSLFLALTAGAVVAAARTDSLTRRNTSDLEAARELATAAIHFAIQDLAKPAEARLLPRNGRAVSVEIGQGRATAQIEDERGKVDILRAPQIITRSLFEAIGREAGVDAFAAVGVAQAASRLFKSERQGEDEPLISTLAEVRTLPGMTGAYFEALSRHITVYGFGPEINPVNATREVLAAIPDVDQGFIDTILANREAGILKRPSAGKAEPLMTSQEGPTYTVRGTGRLANGIEARVTAVVATTGVTFRTNRIGLRVIEYR
jgi:type II secretory pathway component PulK